MMRLFEERNGQLRRIEHIVVMGRWGRQNELRTGSLKEVPDFIDSFDGQMGKRLVQDEKSWTGAPISIGEGHQQQQTDDHFLAP